MKPLHLRGKIGKHGVFRRSREEENSLDLIGVTEYENRQTGGSNGGNKGGSTKGKGDKRRQEGGDNPRKQGTQS